MANKKFVPFTGQIEVKVMKRESIIAGNEKQLLEAGEVIQVGEGAGDFFKVGDIAHFEDFGCSKTTDAVDGVEHYVVLVTPETIRGKHVVEKE